MRQIQLLRRSISHLLHLDVLIHVQQFIQKGNNAGVFIRFSDEVSAYWELQVGRKS